MSIVHWIEKDGSPFLLVATDGCILLMQTMSKRQWSSSIREGEATINTTLKHSKIAKCTCESRNNAAAV